MAITQSDLDELNKAIVSGHRRVKFGDREVEYSSVTEMLRAKSLLEQEMARTGNRKIIRHTRVSFSSGL